MQALPVEALAQWLADPSRSPPVLLDVREPWETAVCQIPGSTLVPMRALPARLSELELERDIVCICHHGGRSAHVAMWLAHQGATRVYNLTGGVDAWARRVDPQMATY